jgi:outer membrane beta-barrel protein
MRSTRLRLLFLLSLTAATTTFAQESLEKVVVRNRLYSPGGHFELGAGVGFTLVSELTDHTNFTANIAYNLSDAFALEVRGGYAYSHHTSLADQISNDVLANQVSPTSTNNGWPNVVDDMANLWEMKLNVIGGLRWSPIYGKISLLAELPVHFQAYLWGGAGAGQFYRRSVVNCQQLASATTCATWETENRWNFVGSAAFGLRFFLGGMTGHSVNLEVRNFVWPDYFLVQIDRRVGQQGSPTGVPASSPGFTNLLLLDVGYSYVF